MLRRPDCRRHIEKAPRLRDLFELYAEAILLRDRLYRENASFSRLSESKEIYDGLEQEISFFLEHSAGCDGLELS